MKIHETEPDSEQRQSDRSPGRRFGIWVRRGDRSRANDVSWPMKTHHEKAAGFSPRSLISRERPADGGRSVTLRGEIQGAHTPRHLTQTLRTRASVARTGLCLPISGVPFESSPGKIWSTSTSLATSPGLDAHAPHVQAPGHVQSHRGCRDTSQTRIVLPNPPVSIRVARLTSPAARLLAG